MSGPKKGRLFFAEQPERRLLASLLGLLGQKNSLDVGKNTTLGNGDAREQFVQFLVVADGQLQVAGDDSGLLVVSSSVACQFQNFSCQVLEDGSQVHGGTGSDTFGVVALAQKTVDSANGELQTGTAGSALCLSLGFSSFTTTRHDDSFSSVFNKD